MSYQTVGHKLIIQETGNTSYQPILFNKVTIYIYDASIKRTSTPSINVVHSCPSQIYPTNRFAHHLSSTAVPLPPPVITAALSSLQTPPSCSTASIISVMSETVRSSSADMSKIVFGPLITRKLERRAPNAACVYGGVWSTFRPDAKAR